MIINNTSLIKRNREVFLFSIILLLGIFFRLWKLNSLPNGIDGDVIITATNSLHIFSGYDFKVFQNNKIVGSPVAYLFWCMPLGSFLIAVFMNIFKQAELGAIFSSVFVGILTIPIVYIFVKKIAGTHISLLSTFFFAISPYHLVYSRSGFTHITIIILLVTLAIYFLFKTIETNKLHRLYSCGIIWGLILFNSYPIAYIVGPISIVYLIWIGKWRWIFSKEFILSVLIAITSFILYSFGFALLNGSPDPLMVLIESYYQWIAVRLNETRMNTSIIKNVIDGLQMIFFGMKPSYQFGVLRIFNFPMINPLIGFTFIVGFAASIIRRNKVDKLLILWVALSFLTTSVINIPQERYLFVLFPVPYIYSAAVIISLYRYGKSLINNSIRKYFPLLIIFILIYAIYSGYRQYFVSYANNNANMIHGLGDGDVAEYLKNNIDPIDSLIISSINSPGIELLTNFQYKNSISWFDFMEKIFKLSSNYYPYGINIKEYPDQSTKSLNDGKYDTYWYVKTPGYAKLYLKEKKIYSIFALFSTKGQGRESSKYSLEYLDDKQNRWINIQSEEEKKGVGGFGLKNLNLFSNLLKFDFKETVESDKLQRIEEILIFQRPIKEQLFPSNIKKLILILALNPNYKYYGNYDDVAKYMYEQAKIIFGKDIDSKLVKTIFGNSGEIIYKIYSLNIKNIQL